MKTNIVGKVVSFAASMLLAFGCTLPVFADNNSSNIPVLKIEQIIIPENCNTQEDIAINVTISDNTDGFLATSFGISFDPELGLTNVEYGNAASMAHCYGANGERGLIWFSGASGSPNKTVNTASTETMFTLYFSLPETVLPGKSFPITFEWDSPDGSTGYWYRADRTNIIGDIKCTALGGGISAPDPNAPKLSESELSLCADDSTTLSVLNYDGSITWISDNPEIAAVKDGTVTAIAPGTCTIYALLGNTSLTCPVLVTKDAVYDITQNDIIYIRNKDKKVSLRCPDVMDASSIVWLSDNMEVVTVANGELTAISNGAASVFALYGSMIYETIVIVELQETADTTEDTKEAEVTYGDVNLDGEVDILDCIILNRNLLGVSPLNDAQLLAADIYKDNKISPMDSLCILKYVLSLLNTVPVTP